MREAGGYLSLDPAIPDALCVVDNVGLRDPRTVVALGCRGGTLWVSVFTSAVTCVAVLKLLGCSSRTPPPC